MKYSTIKNVQSKKIPEPKHGLPMKSEVIPNDTQLITAVFDFLYGEENHVMGWLKYNVKKTMVGWRMATRNLKLFDVVVKDVPLSDLDGAHRNPSERHTWMRPDIKITVDNDENIFKIKAFQYGTQARKI